MYENFCAICQKPLHKYSIKYYCSECWSKFNTDILTHAPWVKVAYAEERKTRFQDSIVCEGKRIPIDIVHLGDKFDIAYVGGGYKLIATKEYFDDGD